MFKQIVLLSALAISSSAVAHADSINGYFSSTGTDSFTNNTITFTPNSAVVAGAVGGTFASYLTDGNPITFLGGALSYSQGNQTAPPGVILFTTSQAGETFAFNLTSYTAAYVNNGTMGCATGSTCLLITGNGLFNGTGAVNYTPSPGTFLFTSQYVANQPLATVTSFSASSSAAGVPSQVPEPSSLALFGSGLLGIVGIARRKFKV